MKNSLAFSALLFDLLLVFLILPFQTSYRILAITFLVFFFMLFDLKSSANLIALISYTDINPYMYGLLTLHPYTHMIILYRLSNYDKVSLIKSITTLAVYNGLWLDKLIKNEAYNLRT